MSFTADELSSLNDIFEKKLTRLQHDLEQGLDGRIAVFRHEIEQRLTLMQQEITRDFTNTLAEMTNSLSQKPVDQQSQSAEVESVDVESVELHESQQQLEHSAEMPEPQQQQLTHIAEIVDHALAAQLIAVDELLNQRLMVSPFENEMPQSSEPAQFDTIEVQTELPWEDLMDVFGRALDERFAVLQDATQDAVKHWEQNLSAQLYAIQNLLRGELLQRQPQSYSGNLTEMQDVFQSIEQLEHIVESMQVAMAANQALLSNRLYHHQQQPAERAHPSRATVSERARISPSNKGVHASSSVPEEQERGEE